MSALRLAVLALAAAILAPTPQARAESLVVSLSTHRVQITSTYTGAELVVFGAIDADRRSIPRGDPFAVVITVKGPRSNAVVREKARFGPIWINQNQRRFIDVPATLAVVSSRPLNEITTEALRQRYRIGFDAIVDPSGLDFAYDGPFRAALLRLKTETKLYSIDERGVTFLTPSIFRAPIPVPGTAPVGSYEVIVSLFSGSVELARETTNFELTRAGFEQTVTTAAHQSPWIYGTLTAAMSLALGWLASVIFRRD